VEGPRCDIESWGVGDVTSHPPVDRSDPEFAGFDTKGTLMENEESDFSYEGQKYGDNRPLFRDRKRYVTSIFLGPCFQMTDLEFNVCKICDTKGKKGCLSWIGPNRLN